MNGFADTRSGLAAYPPVPPPAPTQTLHSQLESIASLAMDLRINTSEIRRGLFGPQAEENKVGTAEPIVYVSAILSEIDYVLREALSHSVVIVNRIK